MQAGIDSQAGPGAPAKTSLDARQTSTAPGLRLEMESVSLVYQAGTPFASRALNEISLVVEPGERLGIAGPVGSGKSSLLAVLAGMEAAASGRVLHDGREVGGKNPPAPGSIGLAFQSPESCLFEKTVYDDVAFSPRRQGLADGEVRRRVEEALAATGLDSSRFGHKSPFSLSAGEQRRVALAGVMAVDPRALLLDEPTAYLDPAARRELIARLVDLNRRTGVTMVMVGHDMQELAAFAERLVIIDGGRKAAEGAAKTILTDVDLLDTYGLDPPGTVVLSRLLSAATGRDIPAVTGEEEAVGLLLRLMADGGIMSPP
ncbi:MAG: ATP-binding cassette domain-containing protein [Thermoleophilia bacterium]